MLKLRALLLVLLVVVSVHAETTVPLSVSSVLTDGYWQSNGQAGRYRVVVTEEGWEHVTNRLLVEWIAEPTARDSPPKIIASAEPTLPFGQSVAAFSVVTTRSGVGCLKISVRGVVSADPSQKVAASLVATSPGNAMVANPTVERACAKSRAGRSLPR